MHVIECSYPIKLNVMHVIESSYPIKLNAMHVIESSHPIKLNVMFTSLNPIIQLVIVEWNNSNSK